MKTREYFRTEAANEMPGSLSHEDIVEAIACMTNSEFSNLQEALKEYNHSAVSLTIRDSICRQYAAHIENTANVWYADYLESLREDQIEQRHENRSAA